MTQRTNDVTDLYEIVVDDSRPTKAAEEGVGLLARLLELETVHRHEHERPPATRRSP